MNVLEKLNEECFGEKFKCDNFSDLLKKIDEDGYDVEEVLKNSNVNENNFTNSNYIYIDLDKIRIDEYNETLITYAEGTNGDFCKIQDYVELIEEYEELKNVDVSFRVKLETFKYKLGSTKLDEDMYDLASNIAEKFNLKDCIAEDCKTYCYNNEFKTIIDLFCVLKEETDNNAKIQNEIQNEINDFENELEKEG